MTQQPKKPQSDLVKFITTSLSTTAVLVVFGLVVVFGLIKPTPDQLGTWLWVIFGGSIFFGLLMGYQTIRSRRPLHHMTGHDRPGVPPISVPPEHQIVIRRDDEKQ